MALCSLSTGMIETPALRAPADAQRALKAGVVLTVAGFNPAAPWGGPPGPPPPAGARFFLVGGGVFSPRRNRAEGRNQPGRAHHRSEHHVRAFGRGHGL